MGIISWIIFGALAGWIASLIMKTNSQQGALANIVIGIAGALIGGWLAPSLGMNGVSGFNSYSLLIAIVGAVLLLALVRAFRLRA